MRHRLLMLLALSTIGCAHLSNEQLVMQVTQAEQAFAASMAERNPAAFRASLSNDTVFFGRKPLHGPDEVMATWQRFFEGPTAPFSWAPKTVVVTSTGDLAFSSGPVRDPTGTVIAEYNSTWRLEAPGVWRIVFDKACDCLEKNPSEKQP